MKAMVLILMVLAGTFLASSTVLYAQEKTDEPTPKLTKPAVVDKKFKIVTSLLITTTIYDAETTFAALKKCSSCRESNPIMRPFVKKGRPATYAFLGAMDGLVIYHAYRLKSSPNPQKRKYWWVGPVAASAAHAAAGSFNLRFVF